MKCIGNKCSGYIDKIGYSWCKEMELRTRIDGECELLKKINEVRDDLIRKCGLFEEILYMDCDESLDDVIDKMGD